MCSFFGKWQPAPVARRICWSGKQPLKEHRGKQNKTTGRADEDWDRGRMGFVCVFFSNLVNDKVELASYERQCNLRFGRKFEGFMSAGLWWMNYILPNP